MLPGLPVFQPHVSYPKTIIKATVTGEARLSPCWLSHIYWRLLTVPFFYDFSFGHEDGCLTALLTGLSLARPPSSCWFLTCCLPSVVHIPPKTWILSCAMPQDTTQFWQLMWVSCLLNSARDLIWPPSSSWLLTEHPFSEILFPLSPEVHYLYFS